MFDCVLNAPLFLNLNFLTQNLCLSISAIEKKEDSLTYSGKKVSFH